MRIRRMYYKLEDGSTYPEEFSRRDALRHHILILCNGNPQENKEKQKKKQWK